MSSEMNKSTDWVQTAVKRAACYLIAMKRKGRFDTQRGTWEQRVFTRGRIRSEAGGYDETKIARLIKLALGGDQIAIDVLGNVVNEQLQCQQPMPEALRDYITHVVRNGLPGEKGRKPAKDNSQRNTTIAYAVHDAHKVWDIDFISDDKRRTKAPVTACDIVKKALESREIRLHLESNSIYRRCYTPHMKFVAYVWDVNTDIDLVGLHSTWRWHPKKPRIDEDHANDRDALDAIVAPVSNGIGPD